VREVTLQRISPSSICPRGRYGWLTVREGEQILFQCFTVERPWMQDANNISCVPRGCYPLVWEYSEHFHRNLWELKNVPGRSEVKIHPANRPEELKGCIALGRSLGHEPAGWYVAESISALEEFHYALKGLAKTTITILDNEATDAPTFLRSAGGDQSSGAHSVGHV